MSSNHNGLRVHILQTLKGSGTSELSFRYIEHTSTKDGIPLTMIDYKTLKNLCSECRSKYEETALQEINATIFGWEYIPVDCYYNKDSLTFYGYFTVKSSESVLDGLVCQCTMKSINNELRAAISKTLEGSGTPELSFRYIEHAVKKDGSPITIIEYNTKANLSSKCRIKYEKTALEQINGRNPGWNYIPLDSYYNNRDRLTFYGYFKRDKEKKNPEPEKPSESVPDDLGSECCMISISKYLITTVSKALRGSGTPELSFRFIAHKHNSPMIIVEYNTSANLSLKCRVKCEEIACQQINATIPGWSYIPLDTFYNTTDRLTFHGYFQRNEKPKPVKSSESMLDDQDCGLEDIELSNSSITEASKISDNSCLSNISSDNIIDGTSTCQG